MDLLETLNLCDHHKMNNDFVEFVKHDYINWDEYQSYNFFTLMLECHKIDVPLEAHGASSNHIVCVRALVHKFIIDNNLLLKYHHYNKIKGTLALNRKMLIDLSNESEKKYTEKFDGLFGKYRCDLIRLKTKERHEFEKFLENLPVCPISQEIIYDPHVLPCGHNFNRSYILDWLRIKNNCPVCRTHV